MRQLRRAGHDVADGVDARLGGLLVLASTLMKPRSSSTFVFSRPMFSVFGLRPTATSSFSASSSSCLPSLVVSVSFTPLPVFWMFSAARRSPRGSSAS